MLGAAQGSIQRGFVKCTQLIVCHKDNAHLQARTGISHLSLNSERSGTEEHLTRQLRNDLKANFSRLHKTACLRCQVVAPHPGLQAEPPLRAILNSGAAHLAERCSLTE